MDYHKLNSWTKKDHFLMSFMDKCLIGWLGEGSIISYMSIRGIIKILLPQKIKKGPY